MKTAKSTPDEVDALVEAVTGVCERSNTEGGNLWQALEEIGVTLLPVPDEYGGAGADLPTTAAVLQTLGRRAASVPVVESALLAGWLLTACQCRVPPGPLTAAVAGPELRTETTSDGGLYVTGRLPRVPWARTATLVMVLLERDVSCQLLLLEPAWAEIEPSENLAAEPRDTLVLDGLKVDRDQVHQVSAVADISAATFWARGALGRALQMAGAAERALDLSVRYAGERMQFGRPLGRLQAVQQMLAVQAGEVAAARVAAEAAALAFEDRHYSELAVAAAKARVSDAAGTVASLAHQVHGAIGFTDEHELHRTTTRLWAWRDEYGNEAYWSERLANRMVAEGGPALWPLLTGTT